MPAYALEIFDDSRSVELYLVRQRGRYIELPIVPPTRGLQLSRPLTSTAGRKIVTHEDSGSFTTFYGGRGTGIHYTLEPTKDGWRVVEKSEDDKTMIAVEGRTNIQYPTRNLQVRTPVRSITETKSAKTLIAFCSLAPKDGC
jgi:hypothetical protein